MAAGWKRLSSGPLRAISEFGPSEVVRAISLGLPNEGPPDFDGGDVCPLPLKKWPRRLVRAPTLCKKVDVATEQEEPVHVRASSRVKHEPLV